MWMLASRHPQWLPALPAQLPATFGSVAGLLALAGNAGSARIPAGNWRVMLPRACARQRACKSSELLRRDRPDGAGGLVASSAGGPQLTVWLSNPMRVIRRW